MTRLKGVYITVEQYRKRIGYTSCQPIYRAIREGRLPGAVNIGNRWIIPQQASIINKSVKHGAYVGLAARVREAKKTIDTE